MGCRAANRCGGFLIPALCVQLVLNRCTCLAAEPATNRLYAGAAAQVLVYDVEKGQVIHTQVRYASAGRRPIDD